MHRDVELELAEAEALLRRALLVLLTVLMLVSDEFVLVLLIVW